MVKKNLIDYVKSLMQKGYDASTIRDVLSKYRYSSAEIDEAINSSFKPTIRHEIHLSHTTVLVIVFIFASLLGIASFFYYSPNSETKLLDLNLEPVTTTAEPGESIIFLKELSNLGSSKRYDVVIKQEIIEPKTSKVITQKIETRAIETFGSTQTKILVPKDTKAGDYILRAIIEYDDKKAVATLPVKIVEFGKSANIEDFRDRGIAKQFPLKETCIDGIKNQNEEGIDCGGVCKACEIQALECNDNNPCTNDVIENNACINKPIVPCCGNNVCEEQENCAADCKKPELPAAISTESLDEIKELAKADPGNALKKCNQIEVPDLKDTCIGNIGEVQRNKNYCSQITNARIKDLCYSNIAKSINDNSLCDQISIDSRKDSCYMTFVLDNKDYSVCDKITNKQLRQSCESLRQLNELQQQSQNQTQEQ
ncbi:hypothetical protein HYX03_00130 [Candidatus Woesearchaeota archaeon]|nr:hypothetical protein [Candidatus Woesearchaeota archaeon]